MATSTKKYDLQYPFLPPIPLHPARQIWAGWFPASTDQDSGAAENNHSAVGGCIPHSGRWLTTDEHGRATEYDHVGRADARGHVPHPSRRKPTNEYGGTAGREDGSANMRDKDIDHRARVHVADASGGLRHREITLRVEFRSAWKGISEQMNTDYLGRS